MAMNDQDLDQCYSALCEALSRQGEAGAPLLLSMLCLSLISRMDNAGQVLPLIAQAQAAAKDGQTDR
jgi:hypothetical protein